MAQSIRLELDRPVLTTVRGNDYHLTLSGNTKGNFVTIKIEDADRNTLFVTKLVYGLPVPIGRVNGVNFRIVPFDIEVLRGGIGEKIFRPSDIDRVTLFITDL